MKKVMYWLSMVLLIVWFLPAIAQQSEGRSSIGIFGSETKLIGGDHDDAVISPWFGLMFTHSFTKKLGVELSAAAGWSRPRESSESGLMSYLTLRSGTPFRTFLYPITANLRYYFRPDARFTPYVTGGVGALFWDLRDVSQENNLFPIPPSGESLSGSQMNAMADVGVGAEIYLSDAVGLDVSVRYGQLFDQDLDMSGYNDVNTGVLEARLGVHFYFGGWKDTDLDGIEDKLDRCVKEAEDFDHFQDEDGCPDLDNDEDGVPDVNDKCPLKAEDKDGYQDDDGCPDPDNDSDGIIDVQDQCPNKAEDKDQFQDEDGCPDADNDGDGIPDVQDKCPNQAETVNGYQDEDGCPDKKPEVMLEKETPIVLKGVTFKTGSAKLTEEAKATLEKVYRTLRDHPEIKIEIRGYTDNVGKRSYNIWLSKQRAEAVKQFLVKRGIDPNRIRAVGLGPDHPIASNKTPEGRAKNRRIEFVRIQ